LAFGGWAHKSGTPVKQATASDKKPSARMVRFRKGGKENKQAGGKTGSIVTCGRRVVHLFSSPASTNPNASAHSQGGERPEFVARNPLPQGDGQGVQVFLVSGRSADQKVVPLAAA